MTTPKDSKKSKDFKINQKVVASIEISDNLNLAPPMALRLQLEKVKSKMKLGTKFSTQSLASVGFDLSDHLDIHSHCRTPRSLQL